MATPQTTVLAAPVPAARADNLVVSEVGDEVLVYDQVQHHIHHLNRTAAVVWRLCDGRRGVEELARVVGLELGSRVDVDVVWFTLDELEKAGLLDRPLGTEVHLPTHTRREVVRRLAVVGAGGLVGAVASVTAIEAASAASGCPPSCSVPNDCVIPRLCTKSCKDDSGNVCHGTGAPDGTQCLCRS